MARDYDQEIAELDKRRAQLEQKQRDLLARLADELEEAGAKWRAARGPRKSLQGRGAEQHPTMTHLQHLIIKSYAAGMGIRAIARSSGVTRDAVRVALDLQKY